MSLHLAAQHLAQHGRGDDSMLIHMTPGEVHGLRALARAHGGDLTTNPHTGLPEAGFLSSMLPTLIGAGLAATGVGLPLAMAGGALAGGMMNRRNPLMGALTGGLGAFGGAGLAEGLGASAAASSAAAAPVAEVAPELIGPQQMAATPGMTPGNLSMADQFSQGVQGLGTEAGRSAAMQAMGGTSGALKAGASALAPVVMGQSNQTGLPDWMNAQAPKYEYAAEYTGGARAPGASDSSEARWFTQPTFRRMAEGGIASLAQGGLRSGGFVVPADVVSMLGNGSSDAGLEILSKKLGATPIDGPGDGMSDSIPTTIEGKQRAAVARQEAYISPEKVQELGGAKKLYALMANIRQQAHGKSTQQRQINPDKVLA